MHDAVWYSTGFIIGFILLIKGADIFIDGASEIAKKKGVSEHVIGLTLVALATSIPELAVSAIASFTFWFVNAIFLSNFFIVDGTLPPTN